MCLMVYIGADAHLPTTAPWRSEAPAFHVVMPDTLPLAVRQQLGTKYVVCAGSYQSCGCGFGYEPETALEELRHSLDGYPEVLNDCRIDWERRRQSVADLRDYLREVAQAQPIRLLATWAGEEFKAPERQLTVTPDYFGGNTFYLHQFTMFEVVNGTDQLDG